MTEPQQSITFNDAAALHPPVWEIMQRQGNNNIRQEDSLLIFLDTKKTTALVQNNSQS